MADDSGALSAVESLLGDRYTREARLAPAFLSVFPVLLVLMLSFNGLQSFIPALLTLLCVFGVVRWISHIARGIGDKKEIKLFRKWGGKPTTTMLRFAAQRTESSSDHLDDQIMHLLGEAPPAEEIENEVTKREGPKLPTAHQDKEVLKETAENADLRADKLDRLYEPSVAWMRENSRGSVLVVEEEISYGFQRNFFALKLFAFVCAVASLLVEARAAHLQGQLAWPIITHVDSDIAAVILTALAAYLFGLVLFVTEKSVMVQGFIYARALLDSFYVPDSSSKPAAKTADAKSG